MKDNCNQTKIKVTLPPRPPPQPPTANQDQIEIFSLPSIFSTE